MTFQTIWIENLRPILFETRHQILLKTVYFAWDDLSSEDIQILSILQIVQELFTGTVYCSLPL